MKPCETELLKYAFENYKSNGSRNCDYLIRSNEKFSPILSALSALEKDEYIEVLSDTLQRETFKITKDMHIKYRLTDSGLDYCCSKF